MKVGLKEMLQRVASAKVMKNFKNFIVFFFCFSFCSKEGTFRELGLIPSSQKKKILALSGEQRD